MVINPGLDASGNGNNWTPINIDWVVPGANYDIMVDVPTNQGTDTGVGSEVRGNYCTWNPLAVGSGTTTSNGNLQSVINAGPGVSSNAYSTIEIPSSVKIYAEFVAGNVDAGGVGVAYPGLQTSSLNTAGVVYFYFGAASFGGGTAKITVDGSTAYDTGANWSGTDILGIAVDRTNSKVWFSKNGTWLGSGTQDPATNTGGYSLGSTSSFFVNTKQNSSVDCSAIANFGQRPFAYTAPSGFKALCTQNLPEPTVVNGGDYFNTVLYTGNGSTQSITGVGFQPDFVWIKSRNFASAHALADVVRGPSLLLNSNLTSAESTQTNSITSFDANGFSLGADSSTWVNYNTSTLVAWNWKANGSGVTNTAGSITSTVSANTTAGFSIVTYTGTGSNATVGHGLGVAPKLVITKNRTSAVGWGVMAQAANSGSGHLGRLLLNETASWASTSEYWNNTAPTSSVFSVGTNSITNASGANLVAYCFAPVEGYSAFGSYTGNGSTDGVFVYTGFRPRWIMVKRTDTTADWVLYDTERNTYNVATLALYPNLSNAEGTVNPSMDILSNGVKFRNLTSTFNASGGTYIYAAFAENPFKLSRAR